jgi:hypothetical protein
MGESDAGETESASAPARKLQMPAGLEQDTREHRFSTGQEIGASETALLHAQVPTACRIATVLNATKVSILYAAAISVATAAGIAPN